MGRIHTLARFVVAAIFVRLDPVWAAPGVPGALAEGEPAATPPRARALGKDHVMMQLTTEEHPAPKGAKKVNGFTVTKRGSPAPAGDSLLGTEDSNAVEDEVCLR
jgi:hypothetical protein